MNILFIKKEWNLEQLLFKERKPTPVNKKKQVKKTSRPPFYKAVNIFRSFRVTQWELAYCSDDYFKSGSLYGLNFLPIIRQHVIINFTGENYLLLKVRNTPWKIVFAWMR